MFIFVEDEHMPGDWSNKCSELQKLCIVRAVRLDRVLFAAAKFIAAKYFAVGCTDWSTSGELCVRSRPSSCCCTYDRARNGTRNLGVFSQLPFNVVVDANT